MDNCFVCGSPHVEVHHILYGTANRKISDKFGYIVPLCQEHHRGNTGVHFDKTLDIRLKQLAQEHYEKNHGRREDFIRIFGRSYK